MVANLFPAVLILVAGNAISTIGRAPALKAGPLDPKEPADKTGNEHV